MKTNICKIIGLFTFIFLNLNTYAQSIKTDVDELNAILKNSLYKTFLVINQKGEVNRKDNNGNIFVYNLSDVAEVKYLDDGFPCAMIALKAGKKSKGQVGGTMNEANYNVIAFNSKADCNKAIEIFKKMIKK
jgi:hypothetical protein